MWMVAAAIISVAAAGMQEAPAPSRPTAARWQVDGGETYCSVVRTPAAADQPVMVLRHVALGLGGDMLISRVQISEHERSRAYTVVVDGEALPSTMGVVQRLPDDTRFLLLRRYATAFLNRIQGARRIEVRQGERTIISSPMNTPAAVLPLLDECRLNAQREAGIGDDVVRPVPELSSSSNSQPRFTSDSPANWLQVGDYPRSALMDEAGGDVGVALIIDPSGRLDRCIIAVSSGRQDLDDATCAAVKRRGRFQPFTGAKRLQSLWFSWTIQQ